MMQLINALDTFSYKQFFEYVTDRKETSLLENDLQARNILNLLVNEYIKSK